jgi:hypothetical protein
MVYTFFFISPISQWTDLQLFNTYKSFTCAWLFDAINCKWLVFVSVLRTIPVQVKVMVLHVHLFSYLLHWHDEIVWLLGVVPMNIPNSNQEYQRHQRSQHCSPFVYVKLWRRTMITLFTERSLNTVRKSIYLSIYIYIYIYIYRFIVESHYIPQVLLRGKLQKLNYIL